MKIVIFGIGYVGFSNALLLSKGNDVVLIDIDASRVECINHGGLPFYDEGAKEFILENKIALKADTDSKPYLTDADIAIIAVPTNYDETSNNFDVSKVVGVIKEIRNINKEVPIVIRSTVPVGFCDSYAINNEDNKIVYLPEFLREGKGLVDALNPNRIIIGINENNNDLKDFSLVLKDFLLNSVDNKYVETLIVSYKEAEVIKLFSNTYLALRIAYFNELDSYVNKLNLDSEKVIRGVSLDPRIGDFYNNPSFGYGGYCLPKDTKQLLANFNTIPQNLIKAVVDSNLTRKEYIVSDIENKINSLNIDNPVIGIYRLSMKKDSDNFRNSSVIDILDMLSKKGYKLVVYEPNLKENNFKGHINIKDIKSFANSSSLIVANRIDGNLKPYLNKVYTRDLYHKD